MYKLDCERPGRGRSSSGLGEFNARAREVELEHEVKRLKQVGPRAMSSGFEEVLGSALQVGFLLEVIGREPRAAVYLLPPLLSLLSYLIAKARHPTPHSGRQLTSGQWFLCSYTPALFWVLE